MRRLNYGELRESAGLNSGIGLTGRADVVHCCPQVLTRLMGEVSPRRCRLYATSSWFLLLEVTHATLRGLDTRQWSSQR